MLLLVKAPQQHFPFCCSVSRLPFSIGSGVNDDLFIQASGFPAAAIQFFEKEKRTWSRHDGHESPLEKFTCWKLDGKEICCFHANSWHEQALLLMRQHLRQSILFLSFFTLLAILLLAWMLAKTQASSPLARQIEMPYPGRLHLRWDAENRIGLHFSQKSNDPQFLTFYLFNKSNIKTLQLGSNKFDLSSSWTGKRYLLLAADSSAKTLWFVLEKKNPEKAATVSLGHLQVIEANTNLTCSEKELTVKSLWEKLESWSQCEALNPSKSLHESVQNTRREMTKKMKSLHFNFLQAKSSGDWQKSKETLESILTLLPDPADPRWQRSKSILGKIHE